MRDFINGILAFIEAEYLTDGEFDSIVTEEYANDLETYQVIKEIIEAREGITDRADRLKSYFEARGVDIAEEAHTPRTNIFIGGAL